MKETILNILKEIRPEFDFTDSEDFIEDGYLDSFDVVTIISELEAAFDVVIDGLDVLPEYFSSVDQICALIERNGGK